MNALKGRARACTSCRQVKSRQQEEVSILSKKISDLQKSLGLDNERDVSPGNAASGSHSVNWHHSRSNGSPTIPLSSHQAAEAPAYSQTEKWLQIEGSVEGSWTVGDLTLNARDVMVLLREYVKAYHLDFPLAKNIQV
ncbi:hypothetical protein MMC14_000697 [Varicellaria rhodocarpa]|nr:hypothetical protein [Varicellaria rhodocarpa]